MKSLVLQQIVGRGSFGTIYKAKSPQTHRTYAVKVLPGSSCSQPQTLQRVQQQIKILLSCKHPHIIHCYSVEMVEQEQSIWIVTDYYKNGSLSDIMAKQKRTFTQKQIRKIMKEILQALVYLHKNNIIHRDIKAANILVDDNKCIKVADFGVSTFINNQNKSKQTRTGSPFWMSPQLLSNSKYTFKTDIWSLGITAMQLAEGVPPYSHQHPYRAIFSIQSHPPQGLTHPQKWSNLFNSFVADCLILDYHARPSAVELLRHPFIMGEGDQQKQSNEVVEDQNEYQQENCDHYGFNSGTMIVHDRSQNSMWDKCLRENILKNQINTKDSSFIKNKDKTIKQKQNKMTVPQLYNQMQEQIKNIRKKYLAKIQQLEQQNTMTFEQKLNRKRVR